MLHAVAHISLPKVGERHNGDAVFVSRDAQSAERVLLAVVDGLGHGPIAAEATHAAIEYLREAPPAAPVLELIQGVHHALRGTRGAAATLCVIHGRRLEICAVGNVQLSCTNTNVPLVLSAGILGHRVAKFRVCEAELKQGSRLGLYSDGISTRFRAEETRHLSAPEACKATIERYRKNEDDATILIADMDG